jgi:hypothetical protein
VMRVAGVSHEITAAPMATFDSYYNWVSYQPMVDTIVRVTSNLYSLRGNRLLWSGTSKTFDPGSAQKVVDDVSRAVGKELKKDRLVI